MACTEKRKANVSSAALLYLDEPLSRNEKGLNSLSTLSSLVRLLFEPNHCPFVYSGNNNAELPGARFNRKLANLPEEWQYKGSASRVRWEEYLNVLFRNLCCLLSRLKTLKVGNEDVHLAADPRRLAGHKGRSQDLYR